MFNREKETKIKDFNKLIAEVNKNIMIPGPPQILTCPFCGGEKQIMSLISGNTFGAELWSDNKQIAPMLPNISYIQKCPHCGKYYILSRQEPNFDRDGDSFETGELNFEETKEAYEQLSNEGFRTHGEEIEVRLMLFHALNDCYGRTLLGFDGCEDDWNLFVEQGKWLIEHAIADNVLKAEFYREIGEFDKASELLVGVVPDDDFIREFDEKIKERIKLKDSKVFIISGEK